MNEAVESLIARAQNRSQYLLAVLATKTNRTSAEITEQEKQEVFNQTLVSLTVQECVDIANEYDAPKMSGPGMIIGNRIEEHFGIE